MKKTKFTFELLLTKDEITAEDWTKLVLVVSQHVKGVLKGFAPLEISVSFEDSVVRYFIHSKNDLTPISQGLDSFLLRAVNPEADKAVEHEPKHESSLKFLTIPTGGNIFDLKERYKVKKGLDLFYVKIKVTRLGARYTSRLYCYFKVGSLIKRGFRPLTMFPAHLLTADFLTNTTYIRRSIPKYVNIEKTTSILLSANSNALFSVKTFPYLPHDYYLNLTSYEFDKHSFIIGSSGSGKSKFIELFIDRLQKTNLAMNYRVIVIDPHAALEKDLVHVPSTKVINFAQEGAQLFPDSGSDISASTELTTTLLKSLMADQDNPRLERVLRFSLFVLFTAQTMSMEYLKQFLTDIPTRTQILEHVKGFIPPNINQFFGADYNEIRTKYYNEAVQPIISLVDEMQLQPSLVGVNEISLAKTIQENFLSVFSLNKVSMGEKVVKTVAGLLIQQIFLMAQSRIFNQKVILIIDEVSIIQNPALSAILAEARKFNLTVILTQQYFGQIEKDLQAAVLSNVVNYYVFRVSEEDARSLEGNITIEIPKELLEQNKKHGMKETDLRVKILTELSPRECLVRVSASGKVLPAVIARTMDVEPRQVAANEVLATNMQEEPAEYERKALPEKFVKQEPAAMQEVAAETQQAEQPPVASNMPIGGGGSHSYEEPPSPGMSLSEILMQQSSSRLNLKKARK